MARGSGSTRPFTAPLFAGLVLFSTAGFALEAPVEEVGAAVEAIEHLGDHGPSTVVPVAAGEELKGLFRAEPANCGGGNITGSYFRMIQPGGDSNGPYIENNSSGCADRTYTDLRPGSDGGLSTADYQPHPDPAFDAGGNGTAERILAPQSFFGRKFAVATNSTDPQTGVPVPVPTVTTDGNGGLSGDLAAFAAAYGGQHFNQGAPKPDGSKPGNTSGPTGTYDAATGRYTLEWASTIVGGPFNNFTGRWHLEGTFAPAAVSPSGAERPGSESKRGGGGSLPVPAPLGQPAPKAVGAAPERVVSGQATGDLVGLFRINAAACASGTPSGSYFRMIQPGGDAEAGPYLSNTSSACADKTYTDLTPGKDGGLSTVAHQPQPDPPFVSSGGTQQGAADRITLPKEFFGSRFATATNPTDPQTNLSTTVVKITADNTGRLSGDTRAFAAAYQGQHFNQGAPKPDGSKPGATTAVSGTYDSATKQFVLEWASTIVGGPFDNFTGLWHFEGTFEPAAAPQTPADPGAPTPSGGGDSASGGATGGTGAPAGPGTLPSTGTAGGPAATSGATPRTGPPWPAALPAGLVALGLTGHRLAGRRKGA